MIAPPMTLCSNLPQAAHHARSCSSYEIHSTPTFSHPYKRSRPCSRHRKLWVAASILRFPTAAYLSPRNGEGGGPWCCAVLSNVKARVCDRSKELPHIQSLRRFPKEELSGKVVLVRFDFSILLSEDLNKESVFQNNALFTIKYLHGAGTRVILISNWSTKGNHKLLSGQHVADHLSSILQLKVVPANCISMDMQFKVEGHGYRDIILLDNLSNLKEELANDLDFAERLSCGVDIFVNDCFSLAHKIRASTVGVTRFCYASVAGFHFEECLHHLNTVSKCNNGPFAAIIGGRNILKKAVALRFLADTCDYLIFVGMMAFEIMSALGIHMPLNLAEQGALEEAAKVVQYAKSRNTSILVPRDFLCANNIFPEQSEIFAAYDILHGWEPVDLGPNSLDEIASLLFDCEKILWVGPVKFRPSNLDSCRTLKLALMLDDLIPSPRDITVVGNMACNAIIKISKSVVAYKMIEAASVVWEFLNGRDLPGIVALDRAYPFEINWHTIYSDPVQPLVVDVGSGNGLFLQGMASVRNNANFLGLEINKKLVNRCLDSTLRLQRKNIYFIATDASSTFRAIVSSYPGPLVLVSIQCPNPDFNRPEYRWRMVQRKLVASIADLLASGGKVFLQSDVEAVAVRMIEQFLKDGKGKLIISHELDPDTLDHDGWLRHNPFGVQSDWERHVIARGDPMYRLMLSKL